MRGVSGPGRLVCFSRLNMNHNIRFFSLKKSYVMIHVIKHDMDPNSNINYRRKIPPLVLTHWIVKLEHNTWISDLYF